MFYEGIEKEVPESKWYKQMNPYYFCRACVGDANKLFGMKFLDILQNHYDLDKIKKIYLNADSGAWIEAGKIELQESHMYWMSFIWRNILQS